MFIYIDKSVSTYLQKHDLKEWQASIFDDLVYGYRNGSCIIRGNDASINILKKRYFNRISCDGMAFNPDIKHLCMSVDKIFVIGFEYLEKPEDLPDYISIKKVDIFLDEKYEEINGGCIFEKCSLIGENLNDIELFDVILKDFIHCEMNSRYAGNFSAENGGGQTIAAVFATKIKERKFVLAVVDSDKKYKGDSYGDTYKNINEKSNTIHSENGYQRCHLYSPDVHEIENLIPLSLIIQMNDTKKYKFNQKAICVLKKIMDSDDFEPLKYYDLKNGLSINKVINNKPCMHYWSHISNHIFNCDINEKTFPELNKNVLKYTIDYLKDLDMAYHCEDDYLREVWGTLGKVLFTWTCGENQTHPRL